MFEQLINSSKFKGSGAQSSWVRASIVLTVQLRLRKNSYLFRTKYLYLKECHCVANTFLSVPVHLGIFHHQCLKKSIRSVKKILGHTSTGWKESRTRRQMISTFNNSRNYIEWHEQDILEKNQNASISYRGLIWSELLKCMNHSLNNGSNGRWQSRNG